MIVEHNVVKHSPKKYMYVCHAEMNAIMNKISANVEGKLFCTFKHAVW